MQQAVRRIINDSIIYILERFEASQGSYDFVDTKFDIVSGRNFDDSDEPFRRKSIWCRVL